MIYNFSLIWAFLAAIVSTTYFFLIKYYAKNNNINILILIILLELLVIYLYYKSLQKTGSAIIYAIINAFSVLLGAFIAILFFGEKLGTIDIIGILLVIFGIIILGQKRSSVNY
jgi:multidrug transporter EmrE-like cation transporter